MEESKKGPAGMTAEKSKALAAALAQIEKQFGKGSIMRLGDRRGGRRHPGGFHRLARPRYRAGRRRLAARPRGRNLRAGIVRQDHADAAGDRRRCRRLGGTAAFIDAEHALDSATRGKLGVNVADLLISQPDTGEQALEIADMLVRSGAIDMIVIDSVAALMPKAEIEGEMGDSLPGLQARLMSQALRKLTGTIKRTQHAGDLHQPDPHEDRRDVRQPGNHHRRQRAEVLRLGAARYPPHRRDQEGRRSHRQRNRA